MLPKLDIKVGPIRVEASNFGSNWIRLFVLQTLKIFLLIKINIHRAIAYIRRWTGIVSSFVYDLLCVASRVTQTQWHSGVRNTTFFSGNALVLRYFKAQGRRVQLPWMELKIWVDQQLNRPNESMFHIDWIGLYSPSWRWNSTIQSPLHTFLLLNVFSKSLPDTWKVIHTSRS